MFKQVRTRTVVQSIWLVEGLQERQKKQNKYKNNTIYFVLFISDSPTRRFTKPLEMDALEIQVTASYRILYFSNTFLCCQREGMYTASSAPVYIYVCAPYLTADEPTKYPSLIPCNYKFPQFLFT